MGPNETAAPSGPGALDRHVPALDGMRAISVLAVLLYHARLGGADSGFLGVSQFFTLSGFLVMSILLRSADRDDLRLRTFWGRRYRRLLPASLLTLAGIVVFGFTVATEQQLDDLVSSIPAAVLQVANWHFVVTDTSYVQLFSTPSPVQHFWSLAIEEQFYLLVPLAFLGLRSITRSAVAFVSIVAVAAIASTVWMWVLFERGVSIDRLYYGTDTRASELLVGCLLAALVWWRPPSLSPTVRRALGGAAVVAFTLTTVAFFAVSVTDAGLYRGGFLVYSLLTAIVIFSAVHDTGPVAAVLRLEPLPSLGRLSYGIYLFHWPLILVLTEERIGVDGWPLFAVQAGTSLALAWISARWFENPIRRGVATPGDRRLPIAVAVGVLALLTSSAALGAVDRTTDLAGLDGDAGSAPPAAVVADIELRVLVVSDGTTDEWLDDFTASAIDTLDVVAVTPALPTTWAATAAQLDADVVHLELNRGVDEAEVSEEAVTDAVEQLVETGVVVTWRRFVTPDDPVLTRHPVIAGLRAAATTLPDFHVLDTNAEPEVVLGELARVGTRATSGARVLIVGDSVSRTIGAGLERWGTETGRALVWSAGTGGCGLINEGWIVDAAGRETAAPASCDEVAANWVTQLEVFDPEIVIVSTNAFDFRERRIDGWDERLEPGDAAFDEFLVDRFIAAAELLSSTDAQLRWVPPACAADAFGVFTEPDGGSALDPARLDHVRDEILPAVGDAVSSLEFFDLHDILCGGDEMLAEVAGVGVLRPDGIHFSAAGSRWLADTYGEELVFGPLQ